LLRVLDQRDSGLMAIPSWQPVLAGLLGQRIHPIAKNFTRIIREPGR